MCKQNLTFAGDIRKDMLRRRFLYDQHDWKILRLWVKFYH